MKCMEKYKSKSARSLPKLQSLKKLSRKWLVRPIRMPPLRWSKTWFRRLKSWRSRRTTWRRLQKTHSSLYQSLSKSMPQSTKKRLIRKSHLIRLWSNLKAVPSLLLVVPPISNTTWHMKTARLYRINFHLTPMKKLLYTISTLLTLILCFLG